MCVKSGFRLIIYQNFVKILCNLSAFGWYVVTNMLGFAAFGFRIRLRSFNCLSSNAILFLKKKKVYIKFISKIPRWYKKDLILHTVISLGVGQHPNKIRSLWLHLGGGTMHNTSSQMQLEEYKVDAHKIDWCDQQITLSDFRSVS